MIRPYATGFKYHSNGTIEIFFNMVNVVRGEPIMLAKDVVLAAHYTNIDEKLVPTLQQTIAGLEDFLDDWYRLEDRRETSTSIQTDKAELPDEEL